MLPPEEIAIIADESWLATGSLCARGDRSLSRQLCRATRHEGPAPPSRWQFFGIPTEQFFYLLGVMALGMAAFKSGLMTGEWSNRAYTRLAAIGPGARLAARGAWASS